MAGVRQSRWGIVGVSHANLVAIANQSKTLEALGGFQPHTVSFAEGDEAERLETATVTSGLFPMLGLTPAAGRLFTTDDERPGAERVAVLSDAIWRRRSEQGSWSGASWRSSRSTLVSTLPISSPSV